MPSRKVSEKVINAWTEEDIEKAIHLCNSTTKSVRSIAKECGVAESTIRFRLQKIKKNEELGKAGRKTCLSVEEERELANCIAVICNSGFSPTINDIEASRIIFFFIL